MTQFAFDPDVNLVLLGGTDCVLTVIGDSAQEIESGTQVAVC